MSGTAISASLHGAGIAIETGTAETAGMVGTVGTVETAGTATAGIGMPGTGTADTRGTTTPGLTRAPGEDPGAVAFQMLRRLLRNPMLRRSVS